MCYAGYNISAPAGSGLQTCLANECSCTGGIEAMFNGTGGSLCETHGAEDCSMCHAGYTISAPAGSGLQTVGVPFLLEMDLVGLLAR